METPETPAVITVSEPGKYVLDHQVGSIELWKIRDEDGPVEPELVDFTLADLQCP